MKNILITGHKGFIGRHLIRHLSYKYLCTGIDITIGDDIRNCYLPKCDAIIHLAGKAGVRASFEQPELYHDINVNGSKRIFDHAEKLGVKVLYASSSTAKNSTLSPYAQTKKDMELIAPENSIGMRFHTVYGSDSRPDMFYRMLLDNTAQYITTHTRDFTSIKDLILAVEILLLSDYTGVLDIGTGEQVQVSELADAIGKKLPYKKVTGEQISSKADISVLKSLGWSPKCNVLDELKNDFLQKNKMEKSAKYGQLVY